MKCEHEKDCDECYDRMNPPTYHPTAIAVTLTNEIREHLKNCLRTIQNKECPDLLFIVDTWARKIAREKI